MLQNVDISGDARVHKPLVIVHCVRSTVGGIFRHVIDLVKHQSACGHHVGLICDSITGGEFEAQKLDGLRPFLSLGVVQLPMSRRAAFTDFAITKKVYQLLSEVNVDVLHCHGAKGGAYGRFAAHMVSRDRRRQNLADVVTVYSPHGGSLHFNPYSPQGRVYFAIERFLENFTDEFIFVAGFEVEAFVRKIKKLRRPWSIAYNGLTGSEFDPVKPHCEAVDFVFAGHMRDLKGADLFLDAIEIANARSLRPITAKMIGNGEDRARYESEVLRRKLSNRITFHDTMPIRDAFSMGRNLVVPSRAEAMPYIVLEAIGARVPLLVTSVGGVPEIYGSHAQQLLPPGDANIIATAMLARLQQPEAAQRFAEVLGQEIQSKFTIDRMYETVDAAYRRHLTGAVVAQNDAQGKAVEDPGLITSSR